MADGTGYSREATNAAGGASSVEGEAIASVLRSLDQIGAEARIAHEILDQCEDLEATAYHLRRIHAHLKFAGGVLADLRKRRG